MEVTNWMSWSLHSWGKNPNAQWIQMLGGLQEMIWTFWTRKKFLMPTIQPVVYSLHWLTYSSSHCNSVCWGTGAETHKLCQLLCKQQTFELTGASNSSRLKVMYAGVLSDVMQVSRAFSAAASCGCCDGFKRLLTAGSGERTVYSTSESWLQATEKNNF
jgi:hypothetical protein